MTDTNESLVPGRSTVLSGGRLLAIDAARAVALVGMMGTHLEPGREADGGVGLAHLLASGRASALFAVLAGVSIALASGGRTPPRGESWTVAAAGTSARAAVVFTVGLALGELDSGLAVILCYYGLLFVVAVPFLPLRAGWLIGLGLASAALAPVLSQWLRESATAPLAFGVPTFGSMLVDPADTFTNLVLTGYYPVLTWTAYLLVGMGIGRLPLRRLAVAVWMTAVGTVVAAAAWVGSVRWLDAGGLSALEAAGTGGHAATGPIDADVLHVGFYGTTPTTSWSWLGIASPHSGAPPDLLHTLGTAVAVIGVMLLLEHAIGRVLWPVAAIGSMTFTLYSLHVVLVATLLPRAVDDALLLHVAIAAAVAIPWRRWVGRGPLEALAARAAWAAREEVARP
ncbi:uncharacterized protein DUF1624 [Mumia flava]|uniref:Uncharacterized protein DUF1624 n=1 Tax=Mumia flava TaxID=1348852 RepID=A0A0B2B996_9ACTN|nr:heparan-alpha-glucosaminide N-acetyltransferase domain-containing protein [Mumia flava]PJJ53719.1 uncharacterized protein DUF1624 [Mumia flava]